MRSVILYLILAGAVCWPAPGQAKVPTRGEVQQAALAVNATLDDYVAIHDSFFAFSLDRISDKDKRAFDDYSKRLHVVNEKLEGALKRLSNAKSIPGPAVKAFAVSLDSYIGLLKSTTIQLLTISEKLSRKTQDPDAYGAEEYFSDIQKYQKAIHAYTAAAEKLNPLYQESFGR